MSIQEVQMEEPMAVEEKAVAIVAEEVPVSVVVKESLIRYELTVA